MKKAWMAFAVVFFGFLGAAEIHLDPVSLGRGGSGAWVTAGNTMVKYSPHFRLRFYQTEVEISVMVPRMELVAERVTGKGNDDPQIFAGETVEIMLSPEPESGIYYHIGVNPAGMVYTAKKRDTSWGKKVQTSVTNRRIGWNVTVRIPYAELGTVFPEKGRIWRVNIGAVMVQVDGKLLSVNWNGATNYHDIAEFGTVYFDDQEVTTVSFWRARAGRVKAVASLAPGENELFCQIGDQRFAASCYNQAAVFDIALPENAASLRDRLKCRFIRADGSTVCEVYAPTRETHLFTLDGFYYTPSMKINFTHDVPDAVIRLRRGGEIVRECAAPLTGSIALDGLPPGDYIVELASRSWRSVRLVKLCPADFAPPAIADDATLTFAEELLKLDGVPHFLVGCSEYPDFPLPSYAAFNLGGARTCIQQNAVCFTPQPVIRRQITYPDADRIVENLLPEIRKSYLARPDHRRSFARLAYEAQLPVHIKTADGKRFDVASQPLFAALYTALKKEYPDRLYSIHVDSLGLIPSFAPYCDILELTSWRTSYSVDLLRFLAEDARAAKHAVKKPVILWLGGALPSPEARSAEQLRFAVYEAMLAKMSGVIFHTGHGGIPQTYGRLWSLLAGINAEIQSVYPDLVQGIDVPDFIQRVTGDFRCVVRRNGTVTRLVVFNLSESEADFAAETRLGALHDVLTPLEVKVYTWRELK